MTNIESVYWDEFIDTSLCHPSYRAVTLSILLSVDSLPDSLVNKLMASLSGLEQIVEISALRNELSATRVRQLLNHDDLKISCATAMGLWLRRPEIDIPSDLREAWEEAILSYPSDFENLWLKDILTSNTNLAYRWVQKHLNEFTYHNEDILAQLIPLLNKNQRSHLIPMLPEDGYFGDGIARALVDIDAELYDQLLNEPHLKRWHLRPLARLLNEDWIRLAELAMQHGYSAEEVAESAFPSSWSWNGNESDMWAQWLPQFERLTMHESPLIRQLGEIGSRITQARIAQARAYERCQAVFGHNT
jgi:hypothetical protein